MVLVALIPGFVSSYIIYRDTSEKMAWTKLNDLMNIVEAKYIHLLDFLRSQEDFVVGLAANTLIKDKLQEHYGTIQDARLKSETPLEDINIYLENLQQESILDEHAMKAEIAQRRTLKQVFGRDVKWDMYRLDERIYRYDELFITDINGKVIASSNKKSIGTDMSKMGFFQEGQKGLFVQDVYEDEEGKTLFGFAAPIFMDGEKLLGVVGVKDSTDFLTDLVTGDLGNEIGGKLFLAGYTASTDFYVINKDGYMITQSKVLKGVENTPLNQEAKTLPWQRGIDEGSRVRDVQEFYPNYAGREVGGASKTVFEMKWMVVGEQNKDEILALAARLMWMIIAVSLAVAAFVGILSYFLARQISRPVMKLASATLEVEKGNYDIQVDVRSKDEVGALAKAFNQMTRQIQVYRNSLEQKNKDLAVAKEAAEEANQTKSDFLARMSHELRTPMNAIIGYSEMLMEDTRDAGQERYVSDLEKIHTAGNHLLQLINDILDLSKVEAHKLELYLETFDVAPMVREVVNTIKPLAEKNANRLEVRLDENMGFMRADTTRMRQVLFNLFSNACKFTEKGIISLDVIRKDRGDSDWIVFALRDTGIGMTPEQMSKLFQPFSQGDTSTTRKYGGTGLGLAISKRFCEMMGGEILVESEYGKGSTFTVSLPASVETERAVLTPVAEKNIAPTGVSTVLVIDDDPLSRDLLNRLLSKEGFRVEMASGGDEGLKLARQLHPNVITLDVLMPDMDGWAVLRALKAEPTLADIPTIMLSIVDDKNLGFTLGAADYVTKPIDTDRLITILNKYRKGHLLVVEDDLSTREMISRMLRKEGWDVVEAENGRVALQRVAEHPPELVLLDLMMPEMDGFEFVAELRRHNEWKSIPIVVVTAKELTAEEHKRLNSSVEKILQKGAYSREELLEHVRDMVKARTGNPNPEKEKTNA
ncbi:MAG: response regulator [Candidatus Omnitrophica bacterium]|nr:response regulator [Candidatus Omnitrophota bacterium]